ncbi:MAG TPA: response regulator [Candidatus Limnocylindria bacterium]|jgi:DNA-binding response OmpR family regulator
MAAHRHRISVLNDNPEFLELMTDILDGDGGYDVTTFEDVTTTVDELAASKPSLVIVDLLLGGASGWEIVALSRADERLSSVPIIICSADVAALRDRADDFERIGNIHVLPKPFGIEELNELVERLLERQAPASG